MDSDLESAYNSIMDAVTAEDIFGELTASGGKTAEAILEERFVRLSAVTDPAVYKASPDDKDLANDANLRLRKFYEAAKARLAEGIYGLKRHGPSLRTTGKLAFKTTKREYYIGDAFAEAYKIANERRGETMGIWFNWR